MDNRRDPRVVKIFLNNLRFFSKHDLTPFCLSNIVYRDEGNPALCPIKGPKTDSGDFRNQFYALHPTKLCLN
jgi:hypothetical protein